MVSQWPYSAEHRHLLRSDPDALLFPGLDSHAGRGQQMRRNFEVAMTERAYFKHLKQVMDGIEHDRTATQTLGHAHVWDDVCLAKVGTHSLKRTAVTLLKDRCTSTSVVGAICGTSALTLDKEYDVPTTRRQKTALRDAFSGVLAGVGNTSCLVLPPCSSCGKAPIEAAWKVCPWCGSMLPSV